MLIGKVLITVGIVTWHEGKLIVRLSFKISLYFLHGTKAMRLLYWDGK